MGEDHCYSSSYNEADLGSAIMNDTNEQEDFSGLSEIHKTLSDAAEVIAAFIGAANSDEIPVDSLLEAADQTLADLVKWRSGLQGVLSVAEVQRH